MFGRIKSWFRGRKKPTLIALDNGPSSPSVVVDSATLDYLHSTAPEPNQEQLEALLKQVRTVRVFEGGSHGDELLFSHR